MELLVLAVVAPLSWIAPRRSWTAICSSVSSILCRLSPGLTRERIESIHGALGTRQISKASRDLRVEIRAGHWHERMQIMREYKPGRWRPNILIKGKERLVQGLDRGRGVILWVSPFTYSDLVTKMAMHRAGVPMYHLSAAARPFTPNICIERRPSRFGRNILSPLRTRIEDRYLKARVLIPRDGSLGYMRRIQTCLRDNGVVSIRAGEAGQIVLDVPLLEGRVRLATGPVSLAHATGATLLPVFTVPAGLDSFEVVIEPAITYGPRPLADHDVGDAVAEYARLLESYILRYPELWTGW